MRYKDEYGKPQPSIRLERTVDGERVVTWTRDIVNHNILEVEAGTNGFHGGATKYGSRTYLRIANQGCTDLHCNVKPYSTSDDDIKEIEITLGGDAELSTIIEALRWILTVLEAQADVL